MPLDGMEWFVPVGLASWMRSNGGCANVTELSWGEERTVWLHSVTFRSIIWEL